jgi:hypothetical protein
MAGLAAACSQDGAPDEAPAPAEMAIVKTAAQALDGAHIPTIDPATLNDAEIGRVIGNGPHCTFHYTRSGRPVLAASLVPRGREVGLVKLNGSLVLLRSRGVAPAAHARDFELVAEPVRLIVRRLQNAPVSVTDRRVPAEMVFDVGQELKVGYGGFLACTQEAPDPVAKQ